MILQLIRNILGLGASPDYKMLVEKGAIIIDVRSVSEFKSGSVPSAKNIPVENILSVDTIVKDKTTPIITICASGMRSGAAKRILKSNGFREVYNGGSWFSLLKSIS